MSSITVNSIFKRFGGEFINKSNHNEFRIIGKPSLTRLGMELNGVFLHEEMLSTIAWGKTESQFLNQLSEIERFEILKKILTQNPPLFLLSVFFQHDALLKELNEKFNDNKTAIIKLDYSTTEIFTLIGTWLAKAHATWATIHGTLLNIFGEGVLIIGEPAIGKSEIALELFKMNHLFLGDDAIDIARLGNTLIAKTHSISQKFIQIRGLGILNLEKMYGSARLIDESKITVIIELKHAIDKSDLQSNFENLGEVTKYKDMLGINIPHYILPITKGRKMGEIIESAIVDLKLKKRNYNSAKDFNERITKQLQSTEN